MARNGALRMRSKALLPALGAHSGDETELSVDAGRDSFAPMRSKLPDFSPTDLRKTLALQVADQIGCSIVREDIVPGDRLREVELADSFEVSRATVRDALRILESRGLVTIASQRGAHVTSMTEDELADIFDIRAALLGLASGSAAVRFKPADGPALKKGLDLLEISQHDANEYLKATTEMITTVCGICGNQRLTELIGSFAVRVRRYSRLALSSPTRRRHSLRSWRQIVKAISSNDAKTAEQVHRSLTLENRVAAQKALRERKDGHK